MTTTACDGLTDLFFSDDAGEQREAMALCARCPLLTVCGEEGTQVEYGVWGGRLASGGRPRDSFSAKDRRYADITALYLDGASSVEISARLGHSLSTVSLALAPLRVAV